MKVTIHPSTFKKQKRYKTPNISKKRHIIAFSLINFLYLNWEKGSNSSSNNNNNNNNIINIIMITTLINNNNDDQDDDGGDNITFS